MSATDSIPGSSCLPQSPRRIRRVMPPECAWAGVLAQDEDGNGCVLVDAAALRGSGVWRWSADGHVAGVQDLVRRDDGLDAMLPLCTERLGAFVAGRVRAGLALTAGECVTLVVSLLRGLAELDSAGGDGAGTTGHWWIDADGRPVFVCGEGEPASQAAADVLETAHGGAPARAALPTEVWASVARLIDDPRGLERLLPGVEETLFAACDAEPLARDGLAALREDDRPARALLYAPDATPEPLRVRDALPAPSRAPDPGAEPPRAASARRARAEGAGWLRHAWSEVTMAVWRRLRSDRVRGPRRPLLVAVVVGAIVLGAGILWPQPAPDAAQAGPGSVAADPAVASATPAPSPASVSEVPAPAVDASQSDPDAPQGSPEDRTELLIGAADALLTESAGCVQQSCRARTQEHADDVVPAGAALVPGRTLSVLDDYGGAAVLRAQAPDAALPDQIVIIVETTAGWRLRDVVDLTQQPARG